MSVPVTLVPEEDNMLYLWKKDNKIDHCYLVLSEGPLIVQAGGIEEFTTEVGPWSLLGK